MVSEGYVRRSVDAGMGSHYQDRPRQEPRIERHKDVLERVLLMTTHPSGPHGKLNEEQINQSGLLQKTGRKPQNRSLSVKIADHPGRAR